VNEKRGAGLWDSAAAREREVAIKQKAGDQRTDNRSNESPPARSTCRIGVRAKATGEEKEADDDESDERADDKTQRQRESIFLFSKIFDQLNNSLRNAGELPSWHGQKLSVQRCRLQSEDYL